MKNNEDIIIEKAIGENKTDTGSEAEHNGSSENQAPVILTTTKGKQIDCRQFDRLKNEDFKVKQMYGKYNNVPMTLKQFLQLQLMSTAYNFYIDKLSDYMYKHPDKNYDYPFGILKSNIENKNDCKKGKDPLGKPLPDPSAAYDICYQEMCARYNIPKVVKRDKTKINPERYSGYDDQI